MGGQRAPPATLNKVIKKSTGKKQGVCLHCGKSGEDSQWRCGNTCCTSCWCKARRAGQPIRSRQPRRRRAAAPAPAGPGGGVAMGAAAAAAVESGAGCAARAAAGWAESGPAAVLLEAAADMGAAGVARPAAAQADMVQRPMQGLGWSSGDEDQAAGSPTDRTSAHSWPHTRTQAPVVLQQDRRGLAETGQGLPLEESPLGGLQLRPGALQRAMSRLAAATQMGALSSSVEGPPAATQRGELSSGMDRLAAATSRGGLMACFERVWMATSERQASTAEPQTQPDAAGRQHQQHSTGRVQAEAGNVEQSAAQAPVTAEGSGNGLQEGSSGAEQTAAQVSAAAQQTGVVQQPEQQRKSKKAVMRLALKTKAQQAKKHGTCSVCGKVGEDSQWRHGGTLCTACYCSTWKRKGSLVAGSRKRRAPDSGDEDYSGSKAGEAGPQERQHEERPRRRRCVHSAQDTEAVLQQMPEEAGRWPSLDNASSTDEGSGRCVVKQRLAAAIKAFLHFDSDGSPVFQQQHPPQDAGQEALGSNFTERNGVGPGEGDGMDIDGEGAAEPSSSDGDNSGMPSEDASHRVWVDVDQAQAALRGLDEDDKISVGILCSLMYHS